MSFKNESIKHVGMVVLSCLAVLFLVYCNQNPTMPKQSGTFYSQEQMDQVRNAYEQKIASLEEALSKPIEVDSPFHPFTTAKLTRNKIEKQILTAPYSYFADKSVLGIMTVFEQATYAINNPSCLIGHKGIYAWDGNTEWGDIKISKYPSVTVYAPIYDEKLQNPEAREKMAITLLNEVKNDIEDLVARGVNLTTRHIQYNFKVVENEVEVHRDFSNDGQTSGLDMIIAIFTV